MLNHVSLEKQNLIGEFHGLKTRMSYMTDAWKRGSATAESAGDIVCRKYEKPRDIEGEAIARANNAKNIYDIMMR